MKVIKYVLIAIFILFAGYGAGLFYTMNAALRHAQQVCDLAVLGMRFDDFEKLLHQNGFQSDGSPEKEDDIIHHTYRFYHMGFSLEFCKVSLENNRIIGKETSMEMQERYGYPHYSR